MVYEKIRRKQARKDLLSGGLLVFLIVLLCIAVIAFWVIGFRTPQNATFRDWFVLVGAVVILGAIICIILLLVNTFLRDKDARKRLVETLKTRGGFGVKFYP
jgi:cation transporter-like permease